MPRTHLRKDAARLAALGLLLAALAFGAARPAPAAAGDVEYTGKFEPELMADTEDFDQVVFKPLRDLSKVKFATPPEEGAGVTAGRLFHPPADKSSVLALLVEPEDGKVAVVNQRELRGRDLIKSLDRILPP
jgi:hypothetical protein